MPPLDSAAQLPSVCTSSVADAAWGKAVRDILKVRDVWSVNLSALELHNAKAKRTAESGGARRIVFGAASTGTTRSPSTVRTRDGNDPK